MKFKYTLFFVCTILFSCATKKKDVVKEKTEQRSEVTNNIKVKEIENIELKEVKTYTLDDFIGVIGDSSRPATVTREVKEGRTVYIFENFKQVQATKNNGMIQSNTNSEKVAETSDKSVKKDVLKENRKDINVDVKRGFQWWWLIIVLAFLFLYLIVNQYVKK